MTTSTIPAGFSALTLLPTQTRLNRARLRVSMLVSVLLAPNFQRTFTPSVKADLNRYEILFLFVQTANAVSNMYVFGLISLLVFIVSL